jgi:hypothetical protein
VWLSLVGDLNLASSTRREVAGLASVETLAVLLPNHVSTLTTSAGASSRCSLLNAHRRDAAWINASPGRRCPAHGSLTSGAGHARRAARSCHSRPALSRLGVDNQISGVGKVMVVRVFVAGGTGVIGFG